MLVTRVLPSTKLKLRLLLLFAAEEEEKQQQIAINEHIPVTFTVTNYYTNYYTKHYTFTLTNY